ncbi:hypothetical protein [Jannaschia sp. W003]|uniref:hypothetical protein n=1 Tax=Jannaschia sp. W003 TaxID=2867012 RepID=UPI0021A26A0E|nr:hypothetical protein [Jannaschia sp. W003]UWQ20606.1 hypothetical protein K3554_11510 [Jannaschia sp. W003]
MSRLAEKLADQIAAEAIRHVERTGDEDVISVLAQSMGDSSQTLQEAFITSVRVQRAAIRAQRLLARRVKEHSGGDAAG